MNEDRGTGASNKILRRFPKRVIVFQVFCGVARGLFRSPVARMVFSVWMLIVLIAPLRHIASTVQQNDSVYYHVFPRDDLGNIIRFDEKTLRKFSRDVAISYAEEDYEYMQDKKTSRILIRLYPRDSVVIARYLVTHLRDVEIKRHPQNTGQTPPTFPPGHTFTARGRQIHFDVAQDERKKWEDLAQVAKRGQKLEPNNAFFDAVLVLCYIELKRDDDAYRVLDFSRRKTNYDDHSMDAVRSIANTLQKAQPHLVEYRVANAYTSSISTFWHALDVLLQESWHSDRRKRTSQSRASRLRSLQRRAKVAEMMAKIYQGHSTQIPYSNRYTFFSVWRNDWSKKRLGRRAYLYENKVLSERFAREAIALQQPQIAAQTREIAAQNESVYRAVRRLSSVGDYDPFSFQKLRWLSRLQGLVLIQMALAAALYILTSLLLTFADRAPHCNRTALRSALIGSIGGAVCLVIAYSLILSGAFNDSNPTAKATAFFIVSLLGFFAVPLMTIVFWHELAKNQNNSAPRGVGNLEAWMIEYSMLPPLRKLLNFAWFGTLSQLWVFAAINFFNEMRGVNSILLPFLGDVYTDAERGFFALALGFPVIIAYFLMLWRWPAFVSQRASSHAKLRGFRASCGVMLATGSVLFLVTLLASLPMRRDISRQFDEYLKHDGLWLATGQESAQWLAKLK